VMQSHAMGYSPWTYGYWTQAPPPLQDFTGNPPPDPEAAEEAPAGAAPEAKAAAPSALGQGKGGQSPANLTESRP